MQGRTRDRPPQLPDPSLECVPEAQRYETPQAVVIEVIDIRAGAQREWRVFIEHIVYGELDKAVLEEVI